MESAKTKKICKRLSNFGTLRRANDDDEDEDEDGDIPRFKPEERQSTLLGGVRTDLIPPSGCKCCRSVEYTLQIYLEGGNSLRTMYFPLIILPAELGVSNEVAEIALMMPPWLFLN
ncbi:hypothetical protein HZH66_004621 [Vespula vulgaris]|uniref:Uncharacterized protein n=1 Tax=Vespula vulgaris TaxID=7454 RepID=A0A834K8E1_VESVU|nr:hypothetical protein HZH66_004621 [Vespula vulgaris]